MRLPLIACLAVFLFTSAAEARPRRGHSHNGVRITVGAPALRVVINPWAAYYRPDPRPGWVWVDGYYDRDGDWVPGYWRPADARPGWDWVPGHWEGDHYIEGYWREVGRPGFVWMEGHYSRGAWIPGYWAPEAPPEPPPPPEPVHHDYE